MHRSLYRQVIRLAKWFIVASLLFSLFTQVTASAPVSVPASAATAEPTRKPEMVKDIQIMNGGTYLQSITPLKDAFYFVVNVSPYGTELWGSQGNEATTHIVKDIAVGPASSLPGALGQLDDKQLIFIARADTSVGDQIWVSDGTELGTQPITHFANVSIDHYQKPVSINGVAYLSVAGTLWRTNGHEDGTFQVTSMPLISNRLVTYGGWVYFIANGPQGTELYRTNPDISDSLLVKDICPAGIICAGGSSGNSNPNGLIAASDRLYFVASDETHGQVLWYTVPDTEGGPDSVTLVADLEGHSMTGFTYRNLTTVEGGLFFIGNDGVTGDELWYSGGTPESTHRVADLNPGSLDSQLDAFVVHGSTLYFKQSYPPDNSLYMTTGNSVEKVNLPLTEGLTPYIAGSTLYFMGMNSSKGYEVWKMSEDGTIQLAFSFLPSPYSAYIVGFWQDKLILINSDPVHSIEPWISDGTQTGTHLLKDISTQYIPRSDISDLTTIYKGSVYFSADSGFDLNALWRSDGTEAGTGRVAGFRSEWMGLKDAAVWDDHLYFVADTSKGQWGGLWRTDGTEQGTERLIDLSPHRFLVAGDWLFFIADGEMYPMGLWALNKGDSVPTLITKTSDNFTQMGALGSDVILVRYTTTGNSQGYWELIRTDGTPESTQVIYGPINSTVPGNTGYPYTSLKNMVFFDNRLFFVAPVMDGSQAFGVYATDGKTVTPVTAPQGVPRSPSQPLVAGNNLYFGGMNNADSVLWRVAKGSSEAQVVQTIAHLDYYQESRLPRPAADLNGQLVFYAERTNAGTQIWLSDGSPEGTQPLCPACGYLINRYGRPAVNQGKLYFSASDTQGLTGNELWVSDGTDAGTHLLADILPGPDSSNPSNLILLGQRLLFVANDGLDSSTGGHGYELWRYDLDTLIYIPAVQK